MKLPTIDHVRAVPRLESAKAAALPGTLRNINAVNDAVTEGANILDKAIENESSMDANRRENEAKREYSKQVTEATQKFHSDPNSSPEAYKSSLDSIREGAFSTASKGASNRTLKYLNPRLDSMRTQIAPAEMELATKAVESKQYMHLQSQGDISAEAVTRDGSTLEAQLGIMKGEIDKMSTLTAAQRMELGDKATVDLSTRAVSTMANDRDLAGVSAFLESEMFYDLTLDQQNAARQMAVTLSSAAIDEDTQVLRNKLARGEVGFDSSLDYALGLNADMPGATAAVKEQSRISIEASMSKVYMAGLVSRREFNTVRDELNSGKFDGYLDPSDAITFSRQATAGLGAKKVAAQASIGYQVSNDMYSLLNGNPGNPSTVIALDETIADVDSTPSQLQTAENQKAQLSIAAGVQPIIASIHDVSTVDLEGIVKNAITEATAPRPEHSQTYANSWGAVATQANTALNERVKDPVAYAYANDPEVRSTWDTATEAFTAAVDTTDPEVARASVQKAQNSYLMYKEAATAAFTTYNPQYKDTIAPVGIPQTAFTQEFAARLAVQSRAEQASAIGGLMTVFGDDAYLISASMTEENPAIGGAVVSYLYNNRSLGDAFLTGQQRMQGEGYNVTTSKILNTAKDNGVTIPPDAAGNYGGTGIEMMEALIASRETSANLQTNNPTREVIEWARDEVFGVPYRINSWGGDALPFRIRETGLMADSDDLRLRFRNLSRGWAQAPENANKIPKLYVQMGDERAEVSYRDALQWVTPILAKTEGHYNLQLGPDNGVGPSGFLVDVNGKKVSLDIMSVPTDSSSPYVEYMQYREQEFL
jgi:hypothetical protein